MKKLILIALCASVAGCATGPSPDHVSSVADRVVYKTVYKAVRQPCPAKEPAAPNPKLARPRPTDPAVLVDLLLAKLKEYDGPGEYVDRVHDFAAICTKPVPPDAK